MQEIAQLDGQKTRELAAEKSGLGNQETYRLAKKVVLDDTPVVIESMDAGAVSINLVSQFVALPEEAKQDAVKEIVVNPDTAKEVIKEAVKKAHVANNSGNNEWYTPSRHIELAQAVMGDIDTDPATSEIAKSAGVSTGKLAQAEIDDLNKPMHWSSTRLRICKPN